jgi:hypothetical protein
MGAGRIAANDMHKKLTAIREARLQKAKPAKSSVN